LLLGGYYHHFTAQDRNGEIIIDGYFNQVVVEQAGDDAFFAAGE
jgi:hypothetical protein